MKRLERFSRSLGITCLTVVLLSFELSGGFKPDVSFAGIKLSDRQSVKDVIGDLHQYHSNDSIYSFKGYVFVSDSLAQYIRLVHFPGDGFDNFSRIEVGSYEYLPNEKYIYHRIFKSFVSESGIRLGLTTSKLTNIKGTPASITKQSNLTVYSYKITGIDSSDFLKKYNMPEYNAMFYFENNALVKYDFGFVYP